MSKKATPQENHSLQSKPNPLIWFVVAGLVFWFLYLFSEPIAEFFRGLKGESPAYRQVKTIKEDKTNKYETCVNEAVNYYDTSMADREKLLNEYCQNAEDKRDCLKIMIDAKPTGDAKLQEKLENDKHLCELKYM